MTLIQSWTDSISLVKPKNLKLFLLVTLKAIVEAYKIVLGYWLFLIVLIGGVCFFSFSRLSDVLTQGIAIALYQLLLFVICLSTRPSIMQKNGAYFISHAAYFLYIACFLLFFTVTHLYATLLVSSWLALSPWYIFLVLFFLDSKRGCKNFLFSMWRALKMVIYNIPLLFIFVIAMGAPTYIFHSYAGLSLTIQLFIGAILLPIPVCVYTNIYIKKLHDHYDIYFKQPK